MEKLAVRDLSPHAGLFENKFTVLGNEVLQVCDMIGNLVV